MSHKVRVGKESFNIPSDFSELWHDHIPAVEGRHPGGLHAISGKTGREAVPILVDAFKRLAKARRDFWNNYDLGECAFCVKYDSKNGWGSASAIVFLGQILGACASDPDAEVYV
jgi:hypothetical protein